MSIEHTYVPKKYCCLLNGKAGEERDSADSFFLTKDQLNIPTYQIKMNYLKAMFRPTKLTVRSIDKTRVFITLRLGKFLFIEKTL